MARFYRTLTLVALLGIVGIVSYNFGLSKGTKALNVEAGFDLSLLNTVKLKLANKFLEKDQLDEKKQMYGAVQGYVAALGDPYTVFLPPTENKLSEDDLKGAFGGVGIMLGYKDSRLSVMSPLAKNPAEKAGIKANDLILKIVDNKKNIDKDTTGISLQEAVTLIRGEVGTEVTLSIFRDGFDKPKDFILVRDTITVPAVELTWKEYKGSTFAVMVVNKFSEKVYEEWPKYVDEVLAKKKELGLKFGGIALDLRNNPGGYLESSVFVASDFISEGVVVTQAETGGKKTEYKVEKSRRKLLNDKLVVLINGGSASASEILAGALHDFKRAKLVGEKSFGKGTVQIPETFKDGSGIHITIAKWLLPSGKNIHKVGVDPDVVIKWGADNSKPEDDMNKVFEELMK